MDSPAKETRDSCTVVCPWCNYRHSDGWEMVNYRTEEFKDGECGSCGKSIRYRVHVSHTYVCEPVGY